MTAPQASSRLEMLQARFQQRQLAEKEQKLLQLYDQQQLRAHQVAQRGSAGSNGSNSSSHGNSGNVSHHQTVTRTSTTTQSTTNSQGGGKVRQMFDERRQTTVKGIDKSYPLEPLDNRSRKHQTTTTGSVLVNSSSPLKNGNPMSNRKGHVVTRRTVRSEANSNVNNGKPIVTYREEVCREIDDSTDRDNEQEEFGDENFQVCQFDNDNRRPGDLDMEVVTNESTPRRHRTTARIHLTEFDRSKLTEFTDDEIIPVSESLTRRTSVEKKASQHHEPRLDRSKNSITKKIGQTTKQFAGNTTNLTKKRNETTVHSGSSSRGSTVTRTMEDKISRANSTSPSFEGTEKPSGNSLPEVANNRGKFTIPMERQSPATKTSGITKVSQLCRKTSTDYYPRRKSEFEKSKTFRKLQLEFGESSPEPNEPNDDSSIFYDKQCEKRSSIFDEYIHSSERRTSSTSPIRERDYTKERKMSEERTPERPVSRRGSQSSNYRRESIVNNDERKETREGIKTSSLESSTYSSRRRTSSSSPIVEQNFFERKTSHEKTSKQPTYRKESIVKSAERKTTIEGKKTLNCDVAKERERRQEKSTERPTSRVGTQSSNYRRESNVKSDERKTTSEGKKTSSVESSIYSSRRRSSSSNPIVDCTSNERKINHEKSPVTPEFRKRSESPTYRKESTINNERRKTTSEEIIKNGERKSRTGETKTAHFDSSTFSSRLHSASPIPATDRDFAEERRSSHGISHEGLDSRERSQSPNYRRGSIIKNEGKTSGESKTTHFDSSTFSSRLHSASPIPFTDRDFAEERRSSHGISHEGSDLRERSQSPNYRRGSIIKNDEGKTSGGMKTSHFDSSTFSSRLHSSSPAVIVDRDFSEDRRTSHGICQESPDSRERSQSPNYRRESIIKNEGKTSGGIKTSHYDSSTFASRLHSASPIPTTDRDFTEERRTSHGISHEGSDLRERSQSPNYRRESNTKNYEGKTNQGIKTSHYDSSTFASRLHSASPIPFTDRDFAEERRSSHDLSHEGSDSRGRSQSPNYRKESITKNYEGKTKQGIKTSHYDSSTFASRLHSASPIPNTDRDFTEERRTSHGISHEGSDLRERSQSPNYRRGTITNNYEGKTNQGIKTSHYDSSTFASRLHSASPIPTTDRDFTEERRTSHGISHEGRDSRERSQSPNYRGESIIKNEGKTSGGIKTSHYDSSTFASRLHSASPIPTTDHDFTEERRTSHGISHEGSDSRERSQSPNYRRGSIIKNDEGKTTSEGIKRSHFDSSTFSSRLHSAAPIIIVDCDFSEDRRTSHGLSHERPDSRERSQSPNYRRGSVIKNEGKTSGESKTTHFDSSTFSSRLHSASPIPFTDRDFAEERRSSHGISHEGSDSRERSQSPNYRRGSIIKNDEGKTSRGIKTSHYDSSTFASRLHSASPIPTTDHDFTEERRTSHGISHEGSDSRERSQSPNYRSGSIIKNDEGKTSRGIKTSHYDSSTFASRLHSASPIPTTDHDFTEERKTSHGISYGGPDSRERSQSPNYRRGSITKNDEEKTTCGGMKKSHFDSSTFSSRLHSAAPVIIVDRDFSEDRRTSHGLSHERPDSRERSQSPNYRRGSITKNDEEKTTCGGMKKSHFDSSTFSSRLHSAAPVIIVDRDFSEDRRTSHGLSHERPDSRERSQSPNYRRGSITKNDEEKTTCGGMKKSHFDSSTFSSRLHSGAPIIIVDHDFSEDRRTSHGLSHERPVSRERSQSPNYRRESIIKNEGKTSGGIKTSHYDSSTFASRLHSASPIPTTDRDYTEERRTSHDLSHESRDSQERSQSPNYRRGSIIKNEGIKTSHYDSSTFASRLHSASPIPTTDRDYTEERRTSHEISHEGPYSRERSQSPNYQRGSIMKNEGTKTSHYDSSTFASRLHSASPIPTTDRDYTEERRTSHEISHEGPYSRERSQSPNYQRGSIMKNEGTKTSHYDSSTFASRLHSASPIPTTDRDYTEERRTSHDLSHESRDSQERSQRSKGQTSGEIKTSHYDSSTFASRLHSASPIPFADRDFTEERRTSHDLSHEGRDSQERCQSPNYRRESIIKNEGKTSGGIKTSHFDSSTFASRLHSASPIPIADVEFSEERKTSYKISHDRPESRGRSESPNYHRESTIKKEGRKTSNYDSSTYSSRCHSSSPTPMAEYDTSMEQKISRKNSAEREGSRRESLSPTYRRESIVKNDEKKATSERSEKSNFDSTTYCSKRRSSSSSPIADRDMSKERESSHDRETSITNKRRKSGGTLRSVELVKKLVRPSSPEKKSATKSFERKVTLEDVEFPEKSSNFRNATRSKTINHKIVKKDKAAMEMVKQEKSVKTRTRKNSRDTRSRTISPAPPTSKTTRETLSFSAKKNDRKSTLDARKNDSKNRREFDEINLTNEKTSKFDSAIVPSTNGKDSRLSSSEITVKRHDTIKETKSNRQIVKIGNEKFSNKSDDLLFDKKIRDESKDKTQLLERIEKIRSTLSRSGRSEQNLQSKEFERTDSVESALKRFDSIGVETEHHVTIGVDETDIYSPKASSERVYLSTSDKREPVKEEICVKKRIEPLCKPTKITVAVLKAKPRKIDSKSRVPSKEKLTRVNLREKPATIGKTAKTKKEQSIIATTISRNSDNKMVAKLRVGQKRATSIVKKSKLRSEESSGRGEGREIDDSPLCKRKLFDGSDSEIENEKSRSPVVLTTVTRVTKNRPRIVEIQTRNNRENVTRSVESILRTKSPGELTFDNEPTRVLRSIEDIRKSIKRESQDFNRELDKFNTAMRRDAEISSMEKSESIVTSDVLSRVQTIKTMKSGDREPVIKIERSTVKLPINRRVAKSPSPDIGAKRTTEGRARNTTTVVRRSVPSSPAKSPDTTNRCVSSELRIPSSKSLGRTSSSLVSRETGSQREFSTTTEHTDCTDGPTNNSEVTVTEIVSMITTKKNNDAFPIDFNDDDASESKENRVKQSFRKRSSERSLSSAEEPGSTATSPPPRSNSALSTASAGVTSARGQSSRLNSKSKMSTKTKSPKSSGPKVPPTGAKVSTPAAIDDDLTACKICGRRFNADRVSRHEQICTKTTTKKRKQFDATIHRVKGTELEPFVKRGGGKKTQADRKGQKPEVKSNWRRKHEDFINAIRSAKQVQAHLAAGGKLSDLPPPPPSDTSDYVQCPHCGRKFNKAAADRHIPKCQTMMHNKPNPRAPPKPKR